MKASKEFCDEMLSHTTALKAFATSLCGSAIRAEDLVQETLTLALAGHKGFRPGTVMVAWLFTILRNYYRHEYRKRRREVEDVDGTHAGALLDQPGQIPTMELWECTLAFAQLPPEQREALILVGASGHSYEEAAEMCECAVGTVKSRVNRARNTLARLVEWDPTTQ